MAPSAAAIAKAFAAAGKGGLVLVPEGQTFMSGPLSFTADNQVLEIASGARLVAAWSAYGNMDRAHFQQSWPLGPKRPEGPPTEWDVQYAPLIYAHNLTNVSIIGPGTIDGGGEAWWNLKDKTSKTGKFPKNMQQRPFSDGAASRREPPIFVVRTPTV